MVYFISTIRYTVDRIRLQQQLEAERQPRELQRHQQAIEQSRAELQLLARALADLQTPYPGETIPLDLTSPAPSVEATVDAVRQYREILSQHLAHTRTDLQRLSERAAANRAAKTLLVELSQNVLATMRTATEVLQASADPVSTDHQAVWQRLFNRLNETDRKAPPAALIELRDAFLTVPSITQAEVLAVELRHRIQQLDQHHRRREEQDAARRYAQRGIAAKPWKNAASPASQLVLSRLANCRCERFSRMRFGNPAGYGVASRACTGDNESLEWYKGARKGRGMPEKTRRDPAINPETQKSPVSTGLF